MNHLSCYCSSLQSNFQRTLRKKLRNILFKLRKNVVILLVAYQIKVYRWYPGFPAKRKTSFAKILHCSRPFCFIFAFVRSLAKNAKIHFNLFREKIMRKFYEKISQKNGNYAKLTKISRKIQNFYKQMQNQTVSKVKEEELFIWHNFAETFSQHFSHFREIFAFRITF